jgi:hypothetical protein
MSYNVVISHCMQALLGGMDRVLREKLGGDGPALLRLMMVSFKESTFKPDSEIAIVQINGIISRKRSCKRFLIFSLDAAFQIIAWISCQISGKACAGQPPD